MSTSSTTQPETAECAYCEGDRDIHASVAGSYCSTECYHAHQGDKALNIVRNDHRLCATCLSFIKSIERPDDEWVNEHKTREQFALEIGGLFHNKQGQSVLDLTNCNDELRTQRESVVGYQYRTENAETVVKEFDGPDKYSRTKQTGTACKCGNTNPRESVETLRESDPATVLKNTVFTFWQLESEGKIDSRLNKDVFFSTYKETRDFEYSLGRALE